MVKQLASNIVCVTGANCSAIYNFNDGNVYSINDFGTRILNNYFLKEKTLAEDESEFVSRVCKVLSVSKLDTVDYVWPEKPVKQLEFAWLEVTQKCPSRCIHCYEGATHFETKAPLPFEAWLKVIEDLSLLGCKTVQFIGGEPTMYPKLPELIRYAKQRGIKVSLFSNLYYVSEKTFNAIIENDVSVHFSIYASNPKLHDSITQLNSSFDNMINNVKRLLENGVNMTAHVVVMKENESNRDEIYSLLSDLKITKIRYDEIRKVYGGCQSKHLVQNSKVMMDKPNFSTDLKRFNSAFYNNTCWYGKCVISTNGNVYPCEFENTISYGSVKQNSLVNIISDTVVDKYWYWDFSQVDVCKDCEYRFACKDCRPLAYAENGVMVEKNPRCTYNPYTGVWESK